MWDEDWNEPCPSGSARRAFPIMAPIAMPTGPVAGMTTAMAPATDPSIHTPPSVNFASSGMGMSSTYVECSRIFTCAVEHVQEAPGLGQREVFRQNMVYPHRRVLIPTDDAHGHGQLL